MNTSDGPTPKFRVIVADPPWRYRNYCDTAHGAAIAHYPTMELEDLQAIPVGTWADDSSVIALWATWPQLTQAVALLEAWDFAFVTGFPWVKTVPSTGEIRRGIGYWTQSASELVLIGRRGEPHSVRKDPVIGLLVGEDRQFYAPIREHSKKPEDLQSWLERRLPSAEPRLELFASRARPGWTTWGHATGFHLSEKGVKQQAIPVEVSEQDRVTPNRKRRSRTAARTESMGNDDLKNALDELPPSVGGDW